MSVFNEILLKINQTSNDFSESIKDDLQSALDSLDKFAEEYLKLKARGRDASQKNTKTNLQSIHEDEDEPDKAPPRTHHSTTSQSSANSQESRESSDPKRQSKKRSKDDVDEMTSPDQDKRPKRNASVRAQGVISKQVNVNLSTKMRREEPTKNERQSRRGRPKRDDGSDKENEPSVIHVKQEKLSLPQEEMECESLPLDVNIKVARQTDVIAMPPPVAPLPKTRGRPKKDKESDKTQDSDEEGRRRNTKSKKQSEPMPPHAALSTSRSTRASSRASRAINNSSANCSTTEDNTMPPPLPEARPKRTRAKKKVSDSTDTEKETTTNSTVTPEKPRPKRTKRGQKATEKETTKPEEPSQEETIQAPIISPKKERISEPIVEVSSPILNNKIPNTKAVNTKLPRQEEARLSSDKVEKVSKMNETVTISGSEMESTFVLPNGKYDHHGSPVKKAPMNETVVIETSSRSRDTMLLDKLPAAPMDATVLIEKEASPNITDDNSLLTEDNSSATEVRTPPRQVAETPTSAVKDKVQQFEELASRVTRTKTRAMAKKEEPEENLTPPDKIGKPVLSAETLAKMNTLIFNGKPQTTISASASKPRSNIPVKPVTSSTSKLANLTRYREVAEETLREREKESALREREREVVLREREDARKKKEALLEAKKEAQRRKREEKMAAAAAAREAAEKERLLAIEQAARDRLEKQAQADQGKMIKLKEAERKKQEAARKAAETEERRRAEQKARAQRLADEQRRAEDHKRRQGEEQEAMKKEAALMAKEIEKRQKEYIEKQKLKQKMEADKIHTPLKSLGASLSAPGGWQLPQLGQLPPEPAYMCDGFDQLNSDSDCDEEPAPRRAVPAWSTSKVRWQQLTIQSHIPTTHIDRLFSVRAHTPDLRALFPGVDRRALKRTSSAVWRTPPQRLPQLAE